MFFDQGYALVIGVGSHKYSPENNVPITVCDADEVRAVLSDPAKCGYPDGQVTYLHDETATKKGILDALDRMAKKVKPEQTLVVFYAGHGAMGTDGQYYLVSHDARFVPAGEELQVKPGTGVSQAELLEKLRGIRAKRTLLIFNACHSGSLHPKSLALRKPQKAIGALSLPPDTAAALLTTGDGRIIITACRPDQLSNFLRISKLTFFTKALTDGLKGKAPASNGFISAFNLYTYVYDEVTRVINSYGSEDLKQEPMITVLQGVGPFAVALYKGKPLGLGLTPGESLPEGKAVRVVTKRESKKALQRVEKINTATNSGSGAIAQDGGMAAGQGGVVIRGSNKGNINTGTQIMRNVVKRDKVSRDKIGKQVNSDGGAIIQGNVQVGGNFAGRDMTIKADDD